MKLGIVSVLLGVVLVVAAVTTFVVWQADTSPLETWAEQFETSPEDVDPNYSDQESILMRDLLADDPPGLTDSLTPLVTPLVVIVGLFWLGVFGLVIGVVLLGRKRSPRCLP